MLLFSKEFLRKRRTACLRGNGNHPKKGKHLMSEKNGSHISERPRGKGGAQILVVDDYFLIRHNFKLLFEKYNVNVLEAANGEEGLKILADYGPDSFSLIIVDLIMPVMNGEEFIKKIKDRFGKRIPPILVCSSATDKPLVKKIVGMGVFGYVVKPIDFRALISKVGQLIPEVEATAG